MSAVAQESGTSRWEPDFMFTCCQLVASALVIYEYFLTLGQEIQHIWNCRATGVTILFFLNRIVMLGMGLTAVLIVAPWETGVGCMIVNWLNIGCAVTILLLWAVVSTLRVYAVSNRDWRLAIGTLILGLVPVMINIVYNAKTSFAPPPDLSSHFCQVITKLSPSVSNLFVILIRVCLIVSDTIVIVVTWYNTYESYQHPTRTATRTSLSRQLFRDGTLYFVLLLGMNVTQLILVLSGIFMAFGTFITMMMSVLISRFILDIRQIRIDSPEAPESIGTIFSCEERPHLVQSRLSSMIFRPSSIPCEDDHAPWMLDT